MARALAPFPVLFVIYQAPEGLGRWLPDYAAQATTLMLLFLPAAWLVARMFGTSMGEAYALSWNRRAAGLLVAGVLVALLAKVAALAIGTRAGIHAVKSWDVEGHPSTLTLAKLAWLAFFTFIPSIAEDILTRGFWLRIPGVPWNAAGFVLFTAVLYVVNHIYRLANGPAEWFMLGCFGLAYAAAFWRFGSLWAAVGLHWGWNLAGSVLGIAWPHEVMDPERSRLLSAGAHLAILGMVLLTLLPGRARRRIA